ncbi:hypothetical protein RIR_jg29687.t1 [Rhizophagus irregularis DAOM 181602=DAOM 197198]|nr:hypothetical protein RIR_jg29687.t1 [Rhizophagus irregularis DAOM 181602=DAOM 197198]
MIMLNFIKTIPFNAHVIILEKSFYCGLNFVQNICILYPTEGEFCNRKGNFGDSGPLGSQGGRFFTIIGIGRGRRCVTRESGNREDAEEDFSSTEDVEGVEKEDVPPNCPLDSEVVKTLYSSVVSFCIN